MKNILIVDDEVNQLKSLRLLLKYSGLSVLTIKTAQSADDATAILAKRGIDLVLSDVNIGSAYGPDLKKMFSNVPFIYLTGDTVWKSPDKSPVLYKPYEVDDLTALIKKTLGESLSENIFTLTRLIAAKDITVDDAVKDLLEIRTPVQ